MPLSIYSNLIRRLLNGRLGTDERENMIHIESVKAWLRCEWYLSKLESPEYFYLRDRVVDEEARKILEDL